MSLNFISVFHEKFHKLNQQHSHEKAQQLQRESAQHISWHRPASSAGCMPRCVVFFKSQCMPAAGGVACALAGQSGGVALLGLRSHSNLNAAPVTGSRSSSKSCMTVCAATNAGLMWSTVLLRQTLVPVAPCRLLQVLPSIGRHDAASRP